VGRSTCLSAETLSAFLDGELAESERRDAQQHLRECAACSGELGAYRGVEALLAAPAPVECATALALLSARHDRELTHDEALVAEAHAAACLSCRSDLAAFDGLDAAIASLPVAIPSTKVDAAIGALVDRETVRSRHGRRGLVAGLALRGAVATALVGAILLAALQPQGGGGPQEALQPPAPIAGGGAIVASVQQVLLNPRTNTLYVAHPDDGTVGALNATTQEDIATIKVGGRPVALALNESANRILVLDDSSTQSLIEIDGATNTVLSSTAFAVSGTVTAIQVDPANGKIFAAVTSAQPQTPPALVVLDGSTKKTESTRTVPVAAQRMVLDQLGQRALLVSGDVTTVVDAATLRQLDQLPGGIAATFSANGSVAVLSANGGGARITIAGAQNASATFDGAPLALIALPQGGYAALVDDGTTGRIVELSADGTVVKTSAVSLVGRDLTYNAKTKTYAVAGDRGVAYLPIGGPSAPAPNAPAAAAAPGASTPPSAATTPSAPSPLAARPGPEIERHAVVPEGATLAWKDMYRLELPGRPNPMVVGRGRAGRLWFVDSTNQLTALDASTGEAFTIAQLPRDATIRSIEVGSAYVYAIDVAASRVFVVSLPSEKFTEVKLPFVKSSAAVTITPDDTLWFAVADQILRYDPRTTLYEAANVGMYSVGSMAADSAGRVWFTDEAHEKLALYDRRNHAVTEIPLPRKGSVTSMVVDGSATLWAGTDAGELFAIRNGELASTTLLARPVLELALDSTGRAWFLSGSTGAEAFGQVQAPAAAQIVPASIVGLWFDSSSHAWLADRTSSGFFIAVPVNGGAR